jgi:hypothetical protein
MITGGLIRKLGAWAIAVLAGYIVAVTAATAAVALSLNQLEVPLTAGAVLRMIVHDWWGLRGMFLPAIALGFAIAMPIAALLARRKARWRAALFALGGAVALIMVHLAMKAAFGITPIAIARTLPGLLTQALAGAAGGWAFATVRAHWR